MKKVAIFTLNGYYNYGNRLQNYALQKQIESLGFEVDTVINDSNNTIKNHKTDKTLNKIKTLAGRYKRKLSLNFKAKKYKKMRTQKFYEFSKKYINETKYTVNETNIEKFKHEKYDYFVTGSDQVWNPNFRKGSSVDFLTFAPKEKRVAYAPSFGISQIPDVYKENYKQWLAEMEWLSVREEAGANIIKELTGREVPVVIDPTLLLSKEDWMRISQVSSGKPAKNYLLTYFLTGISKERKREIQDIALKNDLEVVNLAQIKDTANYVSGPSEFIDYINSASVLLTDSFHGAVFSILLETPFVVYNREGSHPSMNSRIETLTSKFNLESRKAVEIKSNSQIFEVDYTHVQPILETERRKALNYLKEALNIN